MQYCPSCGKSVDDDVAFCPHCGNNLRATSAQPAAQTQEPGPANPPPLTPEQEKAGDRGLSAAVLNFLFWGVGYFRLGVAKPFGRSWLLWPLLYVAYVFAGQVVIKLIHTAGATAITIPTGSSGTTTTIGTGSGLTGLEYDAIIAVIIIVWIAIGLFLARDAYARAAPSSGETSTPSWRIAVKNLYGRMTKPITAQAIESHPAEIFSLAGGLLIFLGGLDEVLDEWLTSTLSAGEKDLEGLVLGLLIIYLAFSNLWPGRRTPTGILIIALALVAMTGTINYGFDLGLGFALIGGALFVALGSEEKQ